MRYLDVYAPTNPENSNESSAYQPRSDSPSIFDVEDEVVLDSGTPSEYALHAVFTGFSAAAEDNIEFSLSSLR